MANHRVTDAAVAAALRQSAGKVQQAAKRLGISRQALHERLARKPLLNPKTSRKVLEETVQHMQTVKLCAAFGETWAAQSLLKLSGWGEEKKARPKVNFTDEEIAEIFDALGTDLVVYDYYKDKLSKGRKRHSLSGRRRIIECAAAKAWNIIPKEVWPKFRSEWVKLQNYKSANERLDALEAASNKNPPRRSSTIHGVELKKRAKCQEKQDLANPWRALDKLIGQPVELDISGLRLGSINGFGGLLDRQVGLNLDGSIKPFPPNFGISEETRGRGRSNPKKGKKSKRGDRSARP